MKKSDDGEKSDVFISLPFLRPRPLLFPFPLLPLLRVETSSTQHALLLH
jgi:hypothetical protein